MTEKPKKILLITVCCLLCVAVAIGIAARFGGNTELPSGVVTDEEQNADDPVVDIDSASGDNSGQQISVDIQGQGSDNTKSDPAQGADSSGTEQTIQADPVKPDAPEEPDAPDGTTTLPDDHTAEDVPEEERKTEDEPAPTYSEQPTSTSTNTEPAAGSTNAAGQVYVPGFGYVDHGGENTVIDGQDIYENGNKIGIMGGD